MKNGSIEIQCEIPNAPMHNWDAIAGERPEAAALAWLLWKTRVELNRLVEGVITALGAFGGEDTIVSDHLLEKCPTLGNTELLAYALAIDPIELKNESGGPISYHLYGLELPATNHEMRLVIGDALACLKPSKSLPEVNSIHLFVLAGKVYHELNQLHAFNPKPSSGCSININYLRPCTSSLQESLRQFFKFQNRQDLFDLLERGAGDEHALRQLAQSRLKNNVAKFKT
ncbi:MAG: hypothetical protein AAGG38_03705 [Planctomycetota bacterium]